MSTKKCYWPNGGVATGYTPCDSKATHSSCCGAGQTCTTHGLCYDLGYISRGGCTDNTWNNEQCPKYCYTADGYKNGTIDGPNYLLPCGIYILAKTWSCAQKNAYGTGIPNCTSERLIRFESPDDIALLPSNSTASTSSTASSASQTNPNTTTSPSSSGVSGGTIGAAVVAGILGLAFLITLGFLLVGIKRRRVERDEADRKISELHSQSMMHPGEVKYPHEAASPPVELAATGRNSELPG